MFNHVCIAQMNKQEDGFSERYSYNYIKSYGGAVLDLSWLLSSFLLSALKLCGHGNIHIIE